MFNPEKIDTILRLEDNDLELLPREENELYEFKSSLVSDNELVKKMAFRGS
jgi:hypothetical protein